MPAARGATALDGAARLASWLGADLVALCSRRTDFVEVAQRCARLPGCRAVAISVPAGYHHDLLPTRTTAPRFLPAGMRRPSDLSLKRNLGLLLAGLRGWRKILLLDDDIEPGGLPTAARRLAAALDIHQIAGLTCNQFPDNSVVCHARRLAGMPQSTFISGAVVGIRCDDHPIPFFPEIYNEDWFFFSQRAAARDLAHVGDAAQAAYDPFATPERARQEEFGDVLGEGLFTLFAKQPPDMPYRWRLAAADAPYWERFIADRHTMIGQITTILEGGGVHDNGRTAAALRSLTAANEQLVRLAPDLCADYLDAWADDLVGWEHATERIRATATTADALDFLGLRNWLTVGEDFCAAV